MSLLGNDESDQQSAFDQLGEAKLHAVIDDFVERVYADTMIGFFFKDFDPVRLKRFEYQLAARALGASTRYEGRPIREAHASHRIMGGQFARRTTILSETMVEHGVPETIRQALLEHTEKLRPLVTAQPGSACKDPPENGPLLVSWSPGDSEDQ